MSDQSRSDHAEFIGTGSASATPDVVVVDARVQVEAPDVAGALAAAAEKATAAFDVAHRHGIDGASLQTSGIGVSPRWDHEGQRTIGQTAYTSFRCVVRNRDDLGSFLHDLAEATADSLAIENVQLQLADTTELVVAAREAAFEEARAKALHYARLSGRNLGAVTVLRDDVGSEAPSPRFRMAAGDTMAAGMPVAAGTSTVTATVVVRWELTG